MSETKKYKGEVKFNHKGSNLDGILPIEGTKTEEEIIEILREYYPTRDRDQFELLT